jgi:hypothetical protein
MNQHPRAEAAAHSSGLVISTHPLGASSSHSPLLSSHTQPEKKKGKRKNDNTKRKKQHIKPMQINILNQTITASKKKKKKRKENTRKSILKPEAPLLTSTQAS